MRTRDLEILGFPRILEALAAATVSPLGAGACRALRPIADRAGADAALDRQWGFFRLIETAGPFPLEAFPDVREALALATHEGALLPGERLVDIRTVLRQATAVFAFLRGRVADHPTLADLPDRLRPLPDLAAALARMLDDGGALHDDASPTLGELRRALRELRSEIETRLDRMVAADRASDAIADDYVTVRNGRFVVPVRAATADRVAGVVQDRSASGETLFVEPLFAIELNNRLLLLRREEEAEERRLLMLLTAQVRTARDELASTIAALAEIDRLAAGAAFARRFQCTRPALADDRLLVRGARHPELLLTGRPVIPIDLRLDGDARALVVSGPNTGGKTVALKTLGLLTLLAHAGVLVPADEGSVLPFVRGVFTDLSDTQSIERDLSTFSSHVANLVEIFATLLPPALVLLDEPGAGTDPEEGAALAVALLDHLLDRGALVAIATHYTPVKIHALHETRAMIAAVDVDPQTFAPRYRLVYGSIGESLGLAMARRLALPESVLARAERQRSTAARELSAAVAALEQSRRRLEDERRAIGEERRALGEAEAEQVRLVAELRARRRARWSAELEEARGFVRELKAEGRALLARTREAPESASAVRAFTRRADATIARHAAALAADEPAADEAPPTVGMQVEVRGTAIRGELVALGAETARIRRGALTFEVPATQLRRPPAAARVPAPPMRTTAPAEVAAEIRLVGLRVHEALDRLAPFLDRAHAAGLPTVRVVHGHGSGALRRAVRAYLERSGLCAGARDAEPAAGGAGVTIVELA